MVVDVKWKRDLPAASLIGTLEVPGGDSLIEVTL